MYLTYFLIHLTWFFVIHTAHLCLSNFLSNQSYTNECYANEIHDKKYDMKCTMVTPQLIPVRFTARQAGYEVLNHIYSTPLFLLDNVLCSKGINLQ